jgi:hypothetical protein
VSRPRDYLAAELAKKLSRHRLVIWDDRDRRYVDVARDLVPPDVAYAEYDGSWFALRRQVEPLLSGPEPGALVAYVPAPPPDQDPLEELRAAAAPFSMTLATLLTKALGAELTQTRIDQLAKQARTLVEAEAALDAGWMLDARLVSIFKTADVVRIAEEVLTRSREDRLDAEGAWALVSDALHAHLGSPPLTSSADAAVVLFRHLALAVLSKALGELPDRLAPALASVTPAQAAQCAAVLERLRRPERLASQRRLGEHFDDQVGMLTSLSWDERLASVDVSPALEELALGEGLALLARGEHGAAHRLAVRRVATSQWALAQPDPATGGLLPGHPHRRWAALDRVALLNQAVEENPPPASASAASILSWYARSGWKVDQAHRLSEITRANLGRLGDLDAHVSAARVAYTAWLEAVVSATTAAIVTHGLGEVTMPRQGDIYFSHLAGKQGPTAYIQVDALRLELGHALAQRLGREGPDGADVCHAAVAGVPTITPIGMPNLGPGAEAGLAISLEGGKVVATVGGTPIRGVPDRVAAIRRAAGAVADLELSDLMNRSDERLAEELAGKDMVLVRSTDIDRAGESDRGGTTWRSVDGMIDDLANQILRLGHLGVRRAVISADHGFLVLPDRLSQARVLERPSGVGDMHMRCWVGRGGLTPPGALRLSLSSLGIGGGLDLIVPEGLSVFPAGGSRQFFHGGLSPQELVVPVLVLDLDGPASSVDASQVAIAVAGKGITTGVFAATMTFTGSLFASQVAVRVVARSVSGQVQVARLVAGDGYDPVSGVVTVSSAPAVLTFQVSTPLAKGTPVEVTVLDVGSGVELARAAVRVLAAVGVEEGWL